MSKKDIKRAREVLEDYRDELLIEMESLDNVLECSLENYDFMIDFAIKMGFKRVVDIGCAYGFQSELCKDRIRYYGINTAKLKFYKNSLSSSRLAYTDEEYPYPNPYNLFKDDLAISNLALGWNCYQSEKDFEETCKALGKDFKASLLYIPQDRKNILFKCFTDVMIVKENDSKLCPTGFYYCYNSEQKEMNK